MNDRLNIWIQRVEESWLDRLHSNAAARFSGTFLPSHDHTHHRRVWNNCRRLLMEAGKHYPSVDQSLVEGVMFAAYFHDLGMARSIREDHGMMGRLECESYIIQNRRNRPARFQEILDAIQRHDIKEEPTGQEIRPDRAPGILEILALADDFDALGNIGIYRYTEIYLKRGIRLRELGIRILGNATARFRNISDYCRICPGLMETYREAYRVLVTFFDNYNQQLLCGTDPEKVFGGHLGIVKTIRTLSVEGSTGPEGFLVSPEVIRGGCIVRNYFKELRNDMEQA